MPRVPLVPARAAGLFGRLGYALSRRRYGAVAEPVQVYAHHPPVLRAYGVWELLNERAMRTLPAGLRSGGRWPTPTR